MRRVAVVSTTLVTLLVAAVALLVIGLAGAVTSYHVLQPAGPQGEVVPGLVEVEVAVPRLTPAVR